MPSDKLRILHLITDLGKGGAERFLIDLCNQLKLNSEVEFVIGSLFDNNQYEDFTKDFKIVNLNYEVFSWKKKNECISYKELLKDFQPQIVHTHRFLAEFLSSYYPNSEIIYICHGHDNIVQLENLRFYPLPNKQSILNWFEKQYLVMNKYRKVKNYFVANSTHTFSYFRNVLPGFMRSRLVQMPYGFDFLRFYRKRQKIYQAGDVIKIVNTGSFQDKKNQVFAVEIAKELKNRGISFEIHFLGDGQNRAKVENYSKQSGLDSVLHFHGNVSRVEEFLWEADIYLHTAWYEPFGLVFLEAMAAGVPVVALDGLGNRDVIENGRNGYIISDQNAGKFADVIMETCNDTEKYRSIVEYAQSFCQAYDIKKIADDYFNFYVSLVRQRTNCL
jgi:glycosyltransferase involved in cell wall biosynthesis